MTAKPGVDFQLLPDGSVLVTLCVGTGELDAVGQGEITEIISYRMDGTEFMRKALPIALQNYAGDWPPPDPRNRPSNNNPAALTAPVAALPDSPPPTFTNAEVD